jgi:transposase InsO family protein
MTENGDPRENPVAERVNGILKGEYLNEYQYLTSVQLKNSIDKYNRKRPHLSCDMLTPDQAHLKTGKLQRRWKNNYRKQLKTES